MSVETVIKWRARALYNKFWQMLPDNPQWLRQILQDNPEVFVLLVRSLQGDRTAMSDLVQRVQTIAREEAQARATTQVTAGLTTEQIQDTIENL